MMVRAPRAVDLLANAGMATHAVLAGSRYRLGQAERLSQRVLNEAMHQEAESDAG